MLRRESGLAVVCSLVGLRTGDPSLRLTAEGAAAAVLGLATAANGLALLDEPALAREIPRPPRFIVADYLPALINALRVFFGGGRRCPVLDRDGLAERSASGDVRGSNHHGFLADVR
jgi:hypothetical protein